MNILCINVTFYLNILFLFCLIQRFSCVSEKWELIEPQNLTVSNPMEHPAVGGLPKLKWSQDSRIYIFCYLRPVRSGIIYENAMFMPLYT